MSINHFTYVPRVCEVCGNNDLEELYCFDYTASTTGPSWLFRVRDVICRNCGFVFVAPAPDTKQLVAYYEKSYAKFKGQQLDYNVNKRIEVILKWFRKVGSSSFYEIGAHMKTDFHSQLAETFSEVYTTDPNQEFHDGNVVTNTRLVDVIGHYFVLEHVPNVLDFLSDCWNKLKTGGLMICEVPDLSFYAKDISALILHEHVNHFTPGTLGAIAAKAGFRMMDTSNEMCSRSFGFVAVFEKISSPNAPVGLHEYTINRTYFAEGLEKVARFLCAREDLYKVIEEQGLKDVEVLLWGANDNLLRLFPEGHSIPENVLVVDSNPKKRDFITGRIVYMPDDVVERIQACNVVILMTNLHSKIILDMLDTRFKKTFEKTIVYDFYNPL